MKFIHLSDLHLGKRVNEFSMLPDQTFILRRILKIIDDERPDAVFIAGDIYDKTVPPTEAVKMFDDLLVDLARRKRQVFIISGNHDSPERIAFGGRLMDASGIHLSPVYDGNVQPIALMDAYGECRVYMLPFVKPVHVRNAFQDEEITSCTDALRVAVRHMNVDPSVRNVLIAHQFVIGGEHCDSEDVSVGGADGVDASVFEPFDYVALGHLHGPQYIGSRRIRYCGTPLKYSFSEKDHQKSVTVVEMAEKGSLTVREIPLTPERDLREIRGTYDELMLRENYVDTHRDDYLRVILTDEEDVPNAMARLRTVYPNIMKLDYDNTRTRTSPSIAQVETLEKKSEMELFGEFYEQQNGRALSDEQRALAASLFERIREGKA